ncbi:MAG: nucleotide exchange factor GrpE [Pseudolabrys sp.]|nr:nucleotide exchange factor GrpE [Pseudolabrys sp.]
MTDRPAAHDTAAKYEGVLPEGEAASAPEMVPAEQVTAALEAAAEFKDKLLRTLAEMENLRKRTEREVADARQYGIAGFARDVVGAVDNMHRALTTIDAELRELGDAKVIAMIEGVELTERELLKAIEKHGVKKFSPEGEKFDPNVHQAMYEVQDSDFPPGHIAQVIQAGYMLGDRVLRPALVAVVKAPSKSPQSSANDNPQPDSAAE